MSFKTKLKISFGIGAYLLLFYLALQTAMGNWFLLAIITVAFLYAAIWVLDCMVPGFNILSHALTRLPNDKGTVALSFDDGPSEPYTRQILDILDKHQASATFFLIGKNVERYPHLAKEIHERGHAIGSHTASHVVLPFASKATIEEEIRLGADAIERATGTRPTLFRCPKGYKSRTIQKIAKNLGMEMIGFSYPIYDVENPPAQVLIERVKGKIKEGDILLMHDGVAPHKPSSRDELVRALPEILTEILKRNLKPIKLHPSPSELSRI